MKIPCVSQPSMTPEALPTTPLGWKLLQDAGQRITSRLSNRRILRFAGRNCLPRQTPGSAAICWRKAATPVNRCLAVRSALSGEPSDLRGRPSGFSSTEIELSESRATRPSGARPLMDALERSFSRKEVLQVGRRFAINAPAGSGAGALIPGSSVGRAGGC